MKKHVNMLKQGTGAWNAWRIKHPENRIDLVGADFSGANLIEADLSEANLVGAYFNEADLSRADLSRADLSRTKFVETSLIGAYFIESNFSGANLIGANLSKAYLNEANLSKAYLNEANLSKAYLRGANLRGANLRGANLRDADLGGTDLRDADLRDADLRGVNLKEANLNKTDLNGANLSKAQVGQTIFASLNLRMVKGVETIHHDEPSEISTSTLERSNGEIPDNFLKGAGVGDNLIEYTHSLFKKPIEYYTCFISYSSRDELFARRLHNDLQQEGVRCWFAQEDLNIGDKIKHRIDESIRLYDKLLLILSEHSIASNWVAYEVERALNKEPQGIPNVLYPVRVDRAIMTCTTIWAQDIKSTRHIGDFEHWNEPQQYQENFQRLLRALNTKK